MMGKKVALSYGILEEQISNHGVEGFAEMVFKEIVDGKTLVEVCEYYGMMYSVMWGWLRDSGDRMEGYRGSLKGRADALMGEVVGIADTSGDAKLMVDTRFKLAGKLDVGRFGDSSKVEVSGSVSLIGLLASLKDMKDMKDISELAVDELVGSGDAIEGEVVLVLAAPVVPVDAVGVVEI